MLNFFEKINKRENNIKLPIKILSSKKRLLLKKKKNLIPKL
jgi:hypothetical protein